MEQILRAFVRSIASQLHPRMLALLIVPFVLAIVFWILIALLLWDPITDWLSGSVFTGNGVMDWFWTLAATIGLSSLREFLINSSALMLVLPIIYATALVIIAVFSMPLVTRHLGNGPYQDVGRRGSWSVMASLWNALSATFVFIVGYLVTLPLWLIPPLGLIIPWLWWAWLTARLMRFDSLVEHADTAERKALIDRHRRGFFTLGLVVTALNYVPPLFLVTPVLSALAYSHYSLALLRERRQVLEGSQAIEQV
jgi:hypothetical protein